MKKIILLLLVLFSFPITLNAEENETQDENVSVQLTASKSSYYIVKLPIAFDVTNNESTFSIYVKGEVDPTKSIQIQEDKGINSNTVHYLENVNNPLIKYELSISSSESLSGSLISNEYNDDNIIDITILHDSLSAGDYTCELPLTIKIVE